MVCDAKQRNEKRRPCWHIFFSTCWLKMIARYCNYLKIVKTVSQHFHLCVCVCVCAVAQLCAHLCDPMDCSLADFSIRAIFQARVLEWVAISFSMRFSRPGDQTQVSCIAGRRFTLYTTSEADFFEFCIYCTNIY